MGILNVGEAVKSVNQYFKHLWVKSESGSIRARLSKESQVLHSKVDTSLIDDVSGNAGKYVVRQGSRKPLLVLSEHLSNPANGGFVSRQVELLVSRAMPMIERLQAGESFFITFIKEGKDATIRFTKERVNEESIKARKVIMDLGEGKSCPALVAAK